MQPSFDLVPELPRALGQALQHGAAVKLAGELGTLLVFGDAPLAGGDRPVTVADGDHVDLVGASLGPDLGAPLLGIDAVGRADLATAQQLRIVAARSRQIVLSDPPKPRVVLRPHAASRSSPSTSRTQPTPTSRRSAGAAAV